MNELPDQDEIDPSMISEAVLTKQGWVCPSGKIGSGVQTIERIREKQDVIIDMILQSLRTGNGIELDGDLKLELLFNLQLLRAGYDSDLLAKNPQHERRPIDRVLITDAVNYIKAVDIGLIPDSRKLKTVAEHFGVSDTSVKNWNKEFTPSVDERSDPEKISRMLEISGKQYKRFQIEFREKSTYHNKKNK